MLISTLWNFSFHYWLSQLIAAYEIILCYYPNCVKTNTIKLCLIMALFNEWKRWQEFLCFHSLSRKVGVFAHSKPSPASRVKGALKMFLYAASPHLLLPGLPHPCQHLRGMIINNQQVALRTRMRPEVVQISLGVGIPMPSINDNNVTKQKPLR